MRKIVEEEEKRRQEKKREGVHKRITREKRGRKERR